MLDDDDPTVLWKLLDEAMVLQEECDKLIEGDQLIQAKEKLRKIFAKIQQIHAELSGIKLQ